MDTGTIIHGPIILIRTGIIALTITPITAPTSTSPTGPIITATGTTKTKKEDLDEKNLAWDRARGPDAPHGRLLCSVR
jgi:hypothetical protein